jgi:hypothetical protein
MPEAAIHKDGEPSTREDNIGAGQKTVRSHR